jgi:SAM-dependent methyltransferase
MVRPQFPETGVVQCDRCLLSFLSPLPSHPEQYYEREYFEAYESAGLHFPTESDELPSRFGERLRDAEQYVGRGSLLEVGVGHGAFLSVAKNSGWRTFGIEVSDYAARLARERYGLDIFCGTLEDARVASASFDFVHMSHVLEHLRDPRGTLKELFRILRPGGLLAVEVPNELDCLQVKCLRAVRLARPYSVRSTHLFFFTPGTLAAVIRGAGFEIRKLRTTRDLGATPGPLQIARRAAALVERPLRMGPLIELLAIRPV